MKHETKSMSADWHESEESHDYDRMEHVINVGDTERVISGIAGGYLLYRGLSGIGEHPVGGLLKTLIGGFLLYRGASGTCPVYTALGKTEGVNRTKALTVRSSIVVDKPREEVYAFWRKLENLPLFMKHLIRVQEHDDIRSTWSADLPRLWAPAMGCGDRKRCTGILYRLGICRRSAHGKCRKSGIHGCGAGTHAGESDHHVQTTCR